MLDDSFEELEIDAVLPYYQDPDKKLFTTIADRSSSLAKTEHIDFSLVKPQMSLDPFILSLSALQNLASLSLHEINTGFGTNDWDNKMSVFKGIGQSCPLLSYLSVSGFTVTKKAVLFLIVAGECWMTSCLQSVERRVVKLNGVWMHHFNAYECLPNT